ncbi:hypothetical protein KAW50_07845 [candidate division WOR-3 bacterium]|nr:hypothetical protein [candidate division WOR-3 bacterium]
MKHRYCDICKRLVTVIYYKENWICNECGTVIKMNESINFFELDKFIIDYWMKHDNMSLSDISKHLSEESLVSGSFSEKL